MPDADTTAPDPPRRTWASHVAKAVICGSGYPGRRLVGTFHRKRSRQKGGRRFTAEAVDGVKLDGWFLPRSADAPRRTPLVMVHGWMEMKEFHFAPARRLTEQGHDVVLFDHRNHGNSGGKGTTFGVLERHDVQRVIDAAIENGMIAPPCVTLGFSLGAATVLQHAPLDERVAGVVAIAPFIDFRTAVESFRLRLAPWMDSPWLQAGFDRAASEHGFAMDEASTLDMVHRLEKPVLMVEGGRDRVLPPTHHTEKLAAAIDPALLERVHVPEANHYNLGRRPWPEVTEAIRVFCNRLPPTGEQPTPE
ncbi:MAG: alpha/beta hydrolase [Phycisphaeraceae bacterium]